MVASLPHQVDIAVVGGGPAGLSLAAILERQGFNYVVFERSARDTPPRGGCLDLHPGSGQLAMKEAGVFEEFKRNSREGDATIHWVYDHEGNKVMCWGEGRDAPEIDRHDIRETLLAAVPPEKILWRKALESTERDEQGQVVLRFTDGTTATGFKLVVGADGTFSKVRPLITPAKPKFAGIVCFTSRVSKSNPFNAALREKTGNGPMVVMGRNVRIWVQIQGTGDYMVELAFLRPQHYGKSGPVDLSDVEAVKKLMLTDEFFGDHAQFFKDMIASLDGSFRDWPLMEMPVDALDWEPAQGVTLIGDSAHTTTPFIGDGANCAMRDAVLLSRRLKELGITQDAIAAYEKEMFAFARPMIANSRKSGNLTFQWDAPKGFAQVLSETKFVGATDHV